MNKMLRSFSRKFFKINQTADSGVNFLYKREYTPHSNLQANYSNEKLNEKFNRKSGETNLEYLIEYVNPSWIEPNSGYALTFNNEVITESIPYNYLYPFPTKIDIFSSKKKTQQKIKEAIYIHYGWKNYYHFHNDILGLFYLLKKNDIDKSIPIVAPQWIEKFPFVTYYLKNFSLLADREIILMKANKSYHFERLIFGKNVTCGKPSMEFVRTHLSSIKIPSTTNETLNKNIFLYRKNSHQRKIKNFSAIASLIESKGFELVDTAEMSLGEQIIRFRNVKNLIAVHGAGIMNLLHGSSRDIKLLEILPATRLGIHYFWLANALDIQYLPVVGSEEIDGEFEIEPKMLEAAMKNLNL